jgi:hypothetical protein
MKKREYFENKEMKLKELIQNFSLSYGIHFDIN